MKLSKEFYFRSRKTFVKSSKLYKKEGEEDNPTSRAIQNIDTKMFTIRADFKSTEMTSKLFSEIEFMLSSCGFLSIVKKISEMGKKKSRFL
jgi:hypothetical protein